MKTLSLENELEAMDIELDIGEHVYEDRHRDVLE